MEPGEFQGVAGRTLEDSTPWWPDLPSAPEGAPNVVVVLLDDVGYAQFGCYGSTISTPTFDRLAANGLRYSNFHTTALCSPTRACLLTGRNHHRSGMGRIVEFASGFPGYDATMPKANGMMPEILVRNGYATFAVGKWHLAPAGTMVAGGSRERWPLGRGFERFYGFLGGETDQYHPDLVHDNHQVDPPRTPEEGYHLTEDMVDMARLYLSDLRAASPTKPFLLWFAPGACHAPAPGASTVDREVRRGVRSRLGRVPRGGVREAGGDGPASGGHRAERAAAVDRGMGLAHRRRAPPLRADDGGVRRLPRAHRRAGRPSARLHRGAGRERQHRSSW